MIKLWIERSTTLWARIQIRSLVAKAASRGTRHDPEAACNDECKADRDDDDEK